MSRIVVLGGGESGVGSAVLAKVKGYDVFLSDMGKISEEYANVLQEWDIPFEQGKHSEELILNADEIIKSPGIPATAPMVQKISERGIGIINASPLSMGLLSQRGTPDWHPAPQALKDACARAAAFCNEQGYPIEKLAIQYSTSLNPRIATTLFSSANPANVLKNIGYVNDPIDLELVAKVKEIIGDQLRVRWKNS